MCLNYSDTSPSKSFKISDHWTICLSDIFNWEFGPGYLYSNILQPKVETQLTGNHSDIRVTGKGSQSDPKRGFLDATQERIQGKSIQ